jgi:molybdenum cofactor cytidylyltransferase
MEAVSCVIPAAGRSQRMGAWKPLLPFRGSTILQTVVASALAACPRVIVVTGHRAEEIEAALHGDPRITLVHNPGWEAGMFSSIQRGAALVDTDRFFIVLGDKPFIRPEVYAFLLAAPAADAIFPVHAGERGHPVLLSRGVREAILAAEADTGSMPRVLLRFTVKEIEWPDDSILRDIDTPEEYAGVHNPS